MFWGDLSGISAKKEALLRNHEALLRNHFG